MILSIDDTYQISLNGQGKVRVEVSTNQYVDFLFDPTTKEVNIGGGVKAFAGVNVNISGGIDLSRNEDQLISGNVGLGVELGIGAHINFEAGFNNGKIDLSLDVGASLGVGFEFDIDVSISFIKIINIIRNFMNGINDGKSSTAEGVEVLS